MLQGLQSISSSKHHKSRPLPAPRQPLYPRRHPDPPGAADAGSSSPDAVLDDRDLDLVLLPEGKLGRLHDVAELVRLLLDGRHGVVRLEVLVGRDAKLLLPTRLRKATASSASTQHPGGRTDCLGFRALAALTV